MPDTDLTDAELVALLEKLDRDPAADCDSYEAEFLDKIFRKGFTTDGQRRFAEKTLRKYDHL